MADYLTRSDYKVMYPADYQNIVLQKIAEGKACFGWADFNVASGGQVYFQLKTNGTIAHMFGRDVTTDSTELTYNLYEGGSFTDGTTEVSLVNINRTLADTPIPITVYSDPSSINLSSAVQIDQNEIFTEAKKSIDSESMAGIDRCLAPNTDYIFEFSHNGNGTARVFAKFFFYFWDERYPQRILDR